jgi:hypothetical protein
VFTKVLNAALKVHHLRRMAHFQVRGWQLAFFLALLISVGTASATVVTVHPAAPLVNPVPADSSDNGAKDPFLSTAAATDYAWHGADAEILHQATVAGVAGGQTEDLGDVIRHRGFGKALLIIIVCGALIRLLTSPAYLKFIADVLDPKAF